MTVESFDDIYDRLQKSMQSNCDSITDYNKGSIIRSIFEAIAGVGHQFYIDTKLGYDNNLKAIPYSVFNFKKKEGQKAVGSVVFSSSSAITSDTTIDKGTIVKSGDYAFLTTEVATIKANETTSNSVGIQAEEIGVNYNVAAESINIISSLVPGNVVSVKNAAKTYNGTDEESDSSLLSRFRTYINGLQGGNTYGIKSAVLSLSSVRSCSIEEHIPLKDDIYSFTVWVDDGSGNMSTSLQQEIEDVINGDDTASNPGKRVAGELFDVYPAMTVPINLTIKATVSRVESELAISEIKQSLESYINNLTIGEDVLVSNLIVVIKKLSYIKSLSIKTEYEGGGDYPLDINQIARAGTFTVQIVS